MASLRETCASKSNELFLWPVSIIFLSGRPMKRFSVFCSVGRLGGFLGCFWNCFVFFRLFMNMSYLSVDAAACLEQADWCISAKLVISHLYSF